MPIQHVIIADIPPAQPTLLGSVLQKNGIAPLYLANPKAALKERSCDFVIAYVRRDGLALLKELHASFPDLPIVLIDETPSIDTSIEALNQGAFHYLATPLTEASLIQLFSRLIKHLQAKRESCFHHVSETKKHQLISESAPMKQILADLDKIAKSSSSVFISGESGTGKEVIAQAIHSYSLREQKPFIKVNCAAIPATLLESEFFGHEKGAFTGATQKKQGRFELAHTGTLLLDEVSEIPMELQAKLLRAVQEREFERVGGVQPLQVDVRLISTSNRSMKEAIEEKLFREDLYYRLNVIPIHLPPLRERKEDIIPLAEFFLERLCAENSQETKRLCSDAKRKLQEYHWPGNIRELANVIERTVIMNSETRLEAHQVYLDLCCAIKESPKTVLPVGITLAELERRLIEQTLSQEKGNRTKTAATLGISLRTLRNKLKDYAGN